MDLTEVPCIVPSPAMMTSLGRHNPSRPRNKWIFHGDSGADEAVNDGAQGNYGSQKGAKFSVPSSSANLRRERPCAGPPNQGIAHCELPQSSPLRACRSPGEPSASAVLRCTQRDAGSSAEERGASTSCQLCVVFSFGRFWEIGRGYPLALSLPHRSRLPSC